MDKRGGKRAIGQSPTNAGGESGGAVNFVKSLWKDPGRWMIVKHAGLFALGVFVVRQCHDIAQT